MFSAEQIAEILESKLKNCKTVVVDDAGDGEHFSAKITSTDFEGRTLVEQHQLVYGALGEHMRRDIHALALKTYTPDKWPG